MQTANRNFTRADLLAPVTAGATDRADQSRIFDAARYIARMTARNERYPLLRYLNQLPNWFDKDQIRMIQDALSARLNSDSPEYRAGVENSYGRGV